KPWTLPPMTKAKAELIEAGMGSCERFVQEWLARILPLPLGACRTEDLFDAFRHWCARNGAKGPSLAMFVAEAVKRLRGHKERRRHHMGDGLQARQSTVIFPPGADTAMDLSELSNQIVSFHDSVKVWRRESSPLGGGA